MTITIITKTEDGPVICDECNEEAPAIARLGETEYPARWMYVCASCLDLASRAIAKEEDN